MSDAAVFGLFVAAAAVGGAVGASELVSRYRDAPGRALATPGAWGYIALNALASVAAFAIVRAFDWQFGATGGAVSLTQWLVASFGAMALLRSALFTVKIEGRDVGIGPNALVMSLLSACDRGVDRRRATVRATDVPRIMQGVSYARAKGPLPAIALALMQNLPAEDQSTLDRLLGAIEKDEEMTDATKALLLGLTVTNAVGTDVLGKAKTALGDDIRDAGGLMEGVSYDLAKDQLPMVALALAGDVKPDAQATLARRLDVIETDLAMTVATKAQLLGLAIADVVGTEALRRAKAALGNEILLPAAATLEAKTRSEAPVVAALEPARGPIAGGTDVAVHGSSFAGATSIAFGSRSVEVEVVSDTRLRTRTPPGDADGVVPVVVASAGGSSVPVPFRYE